jgi:hypothetical protein
MVDPPEKLSNDHAHDTQSFCLANAVLELSDYGAEPTAIGKLKSFAGKLVERFAQGSPMQSAVSSAAAVLQPTDEMKMAELNDPALGFTELNNTGNLVGDRGPDAFVYGGRDGRECVRPTAHVLSAWPQHRIEEDGSILTARLKRHEIQNPIFSSKAEIKSVQDQNQGSFWQAHCPRSRCESSQISTKPPTQPLRSKAIAWSESFQCASVYKHRFESSRTRSLRFAATAFFSDSPRMLALTALTTSRTEVINFGSATVRFRVPRLHARELHTDFGSKYPKTQRISV